MTRRSDYDKRMAAEGRCALCGRRLNFHRYYCDGCRERKNAYQRRRYRARANREGRE